MAIFKRVDASPNNKIFCVRGMDIFLNNTKGKSTAWVGSIYKIKRIHYHGF